MRLYGSFGVDNCPHASVCVYMGPCKSLRVFMGPCVSLLFIMHLYVFS